MKTQTNCPDCTDGFEIINCNHGQKKIPCCRCQSGKTMLSRDGIDLLVQNTTNTRSDETALFESIHELLCGVGDDKVRDEVIAKVNTRIVQLRAAGKTDFDHKC